ncbi:MAG: redox-regulated ATPase YchF [Syntrophorhabdales bacterium]
MGFSCGIIGLPNSGKSTIFNALTALCVAAQPYPFCTIEPNVGIVPVPDARLANLAHLVKPEKVTPTSIEFVDIAGLIKDAHKGEGLGNKFLGHIRAVDAIAHVVRCFKAENIPHVYAGIDPARDADVVETEIVISDLEIVKERLGKLERLAKVSKEKHGEEQRVLLKIKETLSREEFLNSDSFTVEEEELVRSFGLITSKPLFYVANIDERDVGSPEPGCFQGLVDFRRLTPGNPPSEHGEREGEAPAALPREGATRAPVMAWRGRPVVPICGRLEEELASLPPEEIGPFMELYDMKERGIESVVTAGYAILDLITFYTLVGTELRAWTIPKHTTAYAAAGKIHSDMQRGFIKAEVISYETFVQCGSEHAAREKGLVTIEGKEYIVKDGDVLHIRFNV